MAADDPREPASGLKIALDYEWLGLPLSDLINKGNIGLMKAVERFDPEKGGKLSTHSSWWIKQGIKRALANEGKAIGLPFHLVEKFARMRLLDEFGHEPTDAELGQAPRKVRSFAVWPDCHHRWMPH